MSLHSIKVDDQVYQSLQLLQKPRESYNDVVTRLIGLYLCLEELEPVIHGSVNYLAWRRSVKDEPKAIDRRGYSPALSHLPV